MKDLISRVLWEMSLPKDITSFEPKFESAEIMHAVRDASQAEMLTLVLGAGVSNTVCLPRWDQLVGDLFTDIYGHFGSDIARQITPAILNYGYSFPILIRHLETILGFQSSVRRLLRQKLYVSLDETKIDQLVAPLCSAFLDSSAQYPVNQVITYNFDNILERHLRREGRSDVVEIYSNESYPSNSKGLYIYHPHGFLPHADDGLADECLELPVVFSEIDYHLHYMDAGHWANVLQLHQFMHRICLFVGVSITDPNVRRLLDHAKRKTRTLPKHISIQRTKNDSMLNNFIERDLHSLGVRVLWVRTYEDIPRVLLECCGI